MGHGPLTSYCYSDNVQYICLGDVTFLCAFKDISPFTDALDNKIPPLRSCECSSSSV